MTRPPLRIWIWTAATVALVVVAALLWRGSDAAATESTTAAPADVPTGAPAGAVSKTWTTDGDALPASVVESGRVIVGSAHGVHALDPGTGEEAWHYTRSNARLCGLTATNGVAVAIFRTADRCDEAVALNAGTGVRAWTRSVNFRGDAALDSTDRIVLATSSGGVVSLDPTGNNIRWRYPAPGGCRLVDAAVGSTGVAVLQHCAGATALQLRLLDGFDGSPHWTRDLPDTAKAGARLLGADGAVTLRHDDEVQVLAAAGGTLLQTLPVAPGAHVQQTTAGGSVLVRVGDTLSAVEPSSGTVRWQTRALGLPAPAEATKTAAAAALLVPEDGGFVSRDPATGTETGRSTVDGLPDGGMAAAVGPVVVYRLEDRVIGYR